MGSSLLATDPSALLAEFRAFRERALMVQVAGPRAVDALDDLGPALDTVLDLLAEIDHQQELWTARDIAFEMACARNDADRNR